jgi:hypothetical protein
MSDSSAKKIPKAVSDYFSNLGKRATGEKKTRTREHYRKAAEARWKKKKEAVEN